MHQRRIAPAATEVQCPRAARRPPSPAPQRKSRGIVPVRHTPHCTHARAELSVQLGVASAASVVELEATDWQLRADRRRRELARATTSGAAPTAIADGHRRRTSPSRIADGDAGAAGGDAESAERLAAASAGHAPGLYTAIRELRVANAPQRAAVSAIADGGPGGVVVAAGGAIRVLEVATHTCPQTCTHKRAHAHSTRTQKPRARTHARGRTHTRARARAHAHIRTRSRTHTQQHARAHRCAVPTARSTAGPCTPTAGSCCATTRDGMCA